MNRKIPLKNGHLAINASAAGSGGGSALSDLINCAVETLRQDGEFIVARVRQGKDETPCLMAVAALEQPAHMARLENAYALRDELDPTWASRPLRLARYEGKLALLSHDPGGDYLENLLGTPMDLTTCLRIAIGIVTALGSFHTRGLVHREIKPGNLLINATSGEAWLTGFGLTSRLPRHRRGPEPPEVITGTLAYMAPEQTGRMNCSIDSRSDLYSFGVTLYKMLVGALPFTAADPMEWMHCHIARAPIPPNERRNGIPIALSNLVMKLLAKPPEERYQSAAGVKSDLQRCLNAWESYGRIDPFPLGARDQSDRLLIPERLYGRENEIEQLLAAFTRVAQSGRTELVLVSGYSGVGKSSVVNELQKALVPRRGLFASGKFDQFKRETPYATLARAFQRLVRQILIQSDAEVLRWRDALWEALGPNGQLIVDLIPETELIIGKQTPVSDLPPQDAQNRFQMVLLRFLGAFARSEHPLALFLDDLQWLDTATLEFLKQVIIDPDVRHVLLVGAYRDTEVSSTHAITWTLKAFRLAGVRMQEIVLAPLDLDAIGRLVSDSLNCDLEFAYPLTRLVYEKTAGNPFFAIQFLTALAEEGLLVFDPETAAWTWDLSLIRLKGYTDNVVDLVVGKLKRLPDSTQDALKQLACFGNVADISALVLILEESEEEIHAALWEAARTGLIFRQEDTYAFLHGRIQEAAYALIPEGERAAVHLRIGRILASRTPTTEIEEKIFEIVNQLDRGAALINSTQERVSVAGLNLTAGKRAKNSTAHAAALTYLIAGGALLAGENWEERYELMFALEFQRADCEFLTGASAAAEERLALLSGRAANLLDSAAVARLRTELYTTLDQSEQAVEAALEYLRRAGVDWSPHPTKEEVRQEYDRIWQQLGSRPIESLVDLPPMTDPSCRATLDVLTVVEEPANFTDVNLRCLVVARMVNLSLEYGNSDGSCVAYLHLGWLVGPRFGDYEAAFRFGKLALDLVEKHGLERFRARVSQCFSYFVNPWSKHLRTGLELLRRSFTTAQEVGDLKYAAYSCDRLVTFLLAAGDPLGEVQREAENGFEFALKAKFGYIADIIAGQLALIRTLRGLTPSFTSFNDAEFDEGRFERRLEADPRLRFARCWYWILKLQARFYASNYGSALLASAEVEQLLEKRPGLFESAEYLFYDALARAAQYDSASFEERFRFQGELAAHLTQIEIWARNCPENFGNRAALVAAEIARIEGRELEAEQLYEKAIRLSREQGFIQNEAIAHETAARFFRTRGLETIARAYSQNARQLYLRWGALGKVKQLEQHYPGLREELRSPAGNKPESPLAQVDVQALAKASQAVSGELDLDKLIETLLVIALENAGAQRGVLILLRDDEPKVEAEAITSHDAVTVSLRQPSFPAAELPESILRYVIRSQDSVILDDALNPNPFSADGYLHRRRPRSVLCLPLVKQARLVGVLYLENNFTSHAFTPLRIEVLRLLASQAAISLENSRIYQDLRRAEGSARLMASLIENSNDFIGYASTTGQIGFINAAGRRLVGLKLDADLSCLTMSDFRPDEDHRRFVEEILPILSRERHWEGERTLRHFETKAVIPVLQTIFYITEQGTNHRIGFATICRDITERKQAGEALRKVQAELAHVTRVTTMGELAASIAHEVNQPLAGIVINGNASLRWLAGSPPNLGEAREAILRVIRDGKRAGDVITRIRALFKKTETIKEQLEINEVIQEVIVLTKNELRRNKIELQLRLANDLPPVLGDRVQLQQVIMNLLLNAIEAMTTVENRSRELVIKTWSVEGDEVNIQVQDSGVGLDSTVVDRIFDPFETTKAGGLGMGLSISRSIVENHGGRLWVVGHDGPGAVFQFTLSTRDSR